MMRDENEESPVCIDTGIQVTALLIRNGICTESATND